MPTEDISSFTFRISYSDETSPLDGNSFLIYPATKVHDMLSKIYSGMIWKHARFSLEGNFSMTLTWGSEEMHGAAKAIEAIKGYRQSLWAEYQSTNRV